MRIKTITATAALAFIVSSVPAYAHRTKTMPMDRNGDGMISRQEWTGDAATFNRLDVDHNEMLSRDELRNSRPGRRFRGLDRDGNGVITRDEWRGDDQSFRNHDRDGNGVLSGDELRGRGFNRGRKHDRDDDDDHGEKQKGRKDKDKRDRD